MFARSVFQSVLERLQNEMDAEEDGQPLAAKAYSAGPRGLGAGFVVGEPEEARPANTDMVRRAYDDVSLDDDGRTQVVEESAAQGLEPPEPVMPEHLMRLSPEEIAADLALADRETPESLALRRRAFAALNHPDRHLPVFRAQATRRMMIANMLVDEAFRRLQRPSPF